MFKVDFLFNQNGFFAFFAKDFTFFAVDKNNKLGQF